MLLPMLLHLPPLPRLLMQLLLQPLRVLFCRSSSESMHSHPKTYFRTFVVGKMNMLVRKKKVLPALLTIYQQNIIRYTN